MVSYVALQDESDKNHPNNKSVKGEGLKILIIIIIIIITFVLGLFQYVWLIL